MHNEGENLATPSNGLPIVLTRWLVPPTLVSISTGLPIVQQRPKVRDMHTFPTYLLAVIPCLAGSTPFAPFRLLISLMEETILQV
jgi:hypothetical protein